MIAVVVIHIAAFQRDLPPPPTPFGNGAFTLAGGKKLRIPSGTEPRTSPQAARRPPSPRCSPATGRDRKPPQAEPG